MCVHVCLGLWYHDSSLREGSIYVKSWRNLVFQQIPDNDLMSKPYWNVSIFLYSYTIFIYFWYLKQFNFTKDHKISYPNPLALEWKQIPQIVWVTQSRWIWDSVTPSAFCTCGRYSLLVRKHHFPCCRSGWKPELFLTVSLPPLNQLPSPTDFSLCTNQMHLLQSLSTAIIFCKLPSTLPGAQQCTPLGSGCIPSPHHVDAAPTGLL